jgi:hypothetical protein
MTPREFEKYFPGMQNKNMLKIKIVQKKPFFLKKSFHPNLPQEISHIFLISLHARQ